ncbi:MAG: ATP-binding protein [Acidobacteriota bacterium]
MGTREIHQATASGTFDAQLFPKLIDEHLRCVLEVGEAISLEPGEPLFQEGKGSADFYVVLEGRLKVTQRVSDEDQVLAVHEAGEFTGAADMLTGDAASATGRALEPTRVVRLGIDELRQLIGDCPELGSIILRAITQRSNTEFALALQKEKMAALGKLAAGLAHELNNPAAAAGRAADALLQALERFDGLASRILTPTLFRTDDGAPAPPDDGFQALRATVERALADGDGDPLEVSDREDALVDYLEAQGDDDPYCSASSLASGGVTAGTLDALLTRIEPERRQEVVAWTAADVELRRLAHDLAEATGRISGLVQAMKAYSFLDQGGRGEVDLHRGLRHTATILGHKLRSKSLSLELHLAEDVPFVSGYGGELNQVWTNLIHNAIQALEEDGTITLDTAIEGSDVLVRVTDNGPGIPDEVQGRIFEPFFTTKAVGEGTGLGLEAVRRIVVDRHGGTIRFSSRPGFTAFEVRLPIAPPISSGDQP